MSKKTIIAGIKATVGSIPAEKLSQFPLKHFTWKNLSKFDKCYLIYLDMYTTTLRRECMLRDGLCLGAKSCTADSLES